VRLLQELDYRDFRFFRQTLLVRDTVTPSRRLDQAALAGLQASTRCHRTADNQFKHDANVFEIQDRPLAGALARLADARPARLPVAELADTDERRTALFEMFDAGMIDLHAVSQPYAPQASDRPLASPLVRMMIADELPTICTLDHRLMAVSESGPRHLLRHLDGTRDRAALAVIAAEAGLDTEEALDRGLATLAREAVLLR
jgi:hypothetical protein